MFNYLSITFTWFYFETYVCLHYIKLTVKMDADLYVYKGQFNTI